MCTFYGSLIVSLTVVSEQRGLGWPETENLHAAANLLNNLKKKGYGLSREKIAWQR